MLSKSFINAVIDHAEQGHLVAIISLDPQEIIGQIDNEVHVDVISRISRAKGCESIDFINGARIIFHSIPLDLRGRTAHLVVTPMDLYEEDLHSLAPVVATTEGEIIGYM